MGAQLKLAETLADVRLTAAVERLLEVCADRGIDQSAVRAALLSAVAAHGNQRRRSGEPYACHPVEVATLVADLGADVEMVQAALLHDTVEDTELTLDDVAAEFGDEVARLVDGCTKVAQVRADVGTNPTEALRLRKLFVALAADARVVVIKLADRLHNLRTIAALPAHKAARIGAETLRVHGPLAHRLGLAAWKAELEDRAFQVADRYRFDDLNARLEAVGGLTSRLEWALGQLSTSLAQAGLDATVSGRIKHLWSVHTKCERLEVDPEELNDLVAVRATVASQQDCYRALSVVHAMFEHDPARFKDYVTRPKFNAYQSLHTTVFDPFGSMVEVQIRSEAMHDAAERGAAAHHRYKLGSAGTVEWLDRLLDWSVDDEDYLERVALELQAEELVVFSPKGDAFLLPEGATVVDFAYAVHTELGHRCQSATVDSRPVPLSHKLVSGEVVDVVVKAGSTPSLDWLEHVATGRARSAIRKWYTRLWRSEAIDQGARQVASALAAQGLDPLDGDLVLDLVSRSGLRDVDRFYEAVGRGSLSPFRVLAKRSRSSSFSRSSVARESTRLPRSMVLAVEGGSALRVHPALCCRPDTRLPAVLVEVLDAGGESKGAAHRFDCSKLTRLPATELAKLPRAAWVAPGEVLLVFEVSADPGWGVRAALSSSVTSAGVTARAVRRLGPSRWQVVVAAPPSRSAGVVSALQAAPHVTAVQPV